MYKLKQNDDYFDIMIDKSLQGIARVHNGLIVLKGCNAILRKDYMNMIGKVKLISGGKTGNELIYTGFVGPGMLTAAVFGNSHSAPSVNNILNVIEEIGVNHSPGILLIVQNYAEYPINFTLAKVYAEEKGYALKVIIINNNNVPHFENSTKQQDFLPTFFIYKIAGAMAEEGKNIDEIYFLCNSIANNGKIALLKTEFENLFDEEYKEEIFSNIASQTLKPITDMLNITSESKTSIYKTKIFCVGHEVAIMINHFGCNAMETNVFILELLKQIEINNLKVERIYVKELTTHSNNSGFHICFLNLSFDTELIKYLDFSTPVSAWPKIMTSKIIGITENDETKLTISGKYSKNVDWSNINLQGPIINHENSQIFLSVISTACEAIIACTKQLNKMDQEFEDGDYGTHLACGAKAIQDAIQENKILGTNLCVTFTQISDIIQRTVGGLQGGLYSLFFYNIAKAFSKYQSDEEVTANMWLHVLITANNIIKQFKIWSTGDQALLTVLVAMQTDLENALSKNMNPIDAFGTAVQAAESFTTNILYSPSYVKKCKKLKYPDPRAHGVGIWMRAAYESIKLKLSQHRSTKNLNS
ncbi:Triokinase/FMN cyclase [Anthophora quadrimaculata]